TTTTTLPNCSFSTCQTECASSVCADSSGTSGVYHPGPGVLCVDSPFLGGSCSGSCTSDSDCGSGEACATVLLPIDGCCFGFCCAQCPFTCHSSPAPMCGGTCPGGEICTQVPGGDSCGCAPPDDTCLISQAPACGGTCPSGQVCGQVSGRNSC